VWVLCALTDHRAKRCHPLRILSTYEHLEGSLVYNSDLMLRLIAALKFAWRVTYPELKRAKKRTAGEKHVSTSDHRTSESSESAAATKTLLSEASGIECSVSASR